MVGGRNISIIIIHTLIFLFTLFVARVLAAASMYERLSTAVVYLLDRK